MTATRRPNRRDFLMQLVAGGALLAVLSGCAQITAQPGHSGQPSPLGDPRVMKFDPVTFTIPEVERIVLENGIIGREFRKLLYGADHPLGRESTIETVSRITREDLVAFHRQYFTPSGLILGVSGDFEKPAMLDALRKTFGDWKPQPVTLPAIPPVTASSAAGSSRSVNILSRDLTQTHLRVGHLSLKEDDPDYFALALLGDILGGNSFTSRLFRDVRSRQGLAYSVGSRLVPGNRGPGAFLLYALTKGSSTHQALASMLDHMERLRQEPVSDDELQSVKDAFLNSFVFSFANAGVIVGRLMALEYYGLPQDFLERFRH